MLTVKGSVGRGTPSSPTVIVLGTTLTIVDDGVAPPWGMDMLERINRNITVQIVSVFFLFGIFFHKFLSAP
jgi:hypothetical protein